MIKFLLHDVYDFGINVAYLLHIDEGAVIGEPASRGGHDFHAAIDDFFGMLDRLGLHTTRNASNRLREIARSCTDKGAAYRLSREESDSINREIGNVSGTLDAEMKNVALFQTTEKRYDTEKLTTDVSSLLGRASFDKMPDIAQYDMTMAGRCLAFELFTAAAFHSLRATEAVIRAFHVAIVGGPLPRDPWGQVTADIRRVTLNTHDRLLGVLDTLRHNYRNPTQHPEIRYDSSQAQDIFAQCIAAINLMTPTLPPA